MFDSPLVIISMYKIVISILILVCYTIPAITNAVEFDRLFTTSEQRQKLDELRSAQPETVVEADDEESNIEQEKEGTVVKGAVYRSSGNNAVWINKSGKGDKLLLKMGKNFNLVGKDVRKIKQIRKSEPQTQLSD